MKRITFDGNFCDIAMCRETPGGSFCENGSCSQRQVWEKLKYYEDMEEQGRLVVLPFLPNEEVWDYTEFFDGTPYAEYYMLRDSFIGVGVSANGERTFEYDCFTIVPEQIGKTIFLTKEEAEVALAAREG